MSELPGRYRSSATIADGWTLERLTPPSRLFGANGMRTGRDGRIYVAQVAGSQVSALDPDSGAIETVVPMGGAVTAPDDLAFDDEGNIYVTEITLGRVSMVRPDGSSQVINGDMPVANPIMVHQNRLIAGECRIGARIMELDRNGGAPRVLIDNVPMANAFDVGPDGKLYFPVMGMNEIWRIGLDGGAPEVVAKDLGVPDSVKFHPDGYIVSTQVHSGQVLRIDPLTGDRSVLADLVPGLDNVTFVGKRIFISHITGSIHEIIAPGDARPAIARGLQWPLGIAEAADGTLCVSDGGFCYELAPGGAMELVGMLFSPGFPGWVRAVIAGDAAGEWIVTTANGDVARWRPREQASEPVASGFDRLMGLARTPGGALVFAEYGTGRVLSATTGAVEELARGLAGPTGVALATDGTCYVSEADGGRIVRLAGGRVETVLDGLSRPEGLAISGDRLAVVDTLAKEVVTCDLAGGLRAVVASGMPVGGPAGQTGRSLGGVGDMCGPMTAFCGLCAGADGSLFVAGDAEGSVLALRPRRS